jgi:uncharacterized protein YhjY with autotransporter beta-barrel domain
MNPRKITLIIIIFFNHVLYAGTQGQFSDLAVEVTANSDAFFAGQRSIITSTLSNNGPDAASSVEMAITINSPNQIRNVSIESAMNCQFNAPQIICQTDNLGVNASTAVNISFIPTIAESNEYSIQILATVASNNTDENQSNNTDSRVIQVTSTPTQEQWGDALIDVLGSDSPRLNQMVRALAAYCGTDNNFLTGMGGNCDNLFFEALNGNKTIVKRVLRRLRPREVVQQARTSIEIIATQQANVAARMAQLRAGVNNSFAGLNIEAGGKILPIEMLAYLADNDVTDSYDQLVTPWGFFINGQISSGDYRYEDARDEGFDFDTRGITAGVDYRFNDKTVIGVALGYADFDSNVGTEAKMNSTSLTFSAYGSFTVSDNFYVDVKASYGKPEFDQQRALQFNLTDSQTDVKVTGNTDGTQKSFVISSGYQFNRNGWQITPAASAEYYSTDIDAFVETGAAAFNVGFSEQNFETNRFTASVQVNKSISLNRGVLIPSIGYEAIHENQNGDDFVLMRISGMPAGEFFRVATDFNDNDYNSGNIGVVYVGEHGKQAYLQYSKSFSRDGFNKSTLSVGARFEF